MGRLFVASILLSIIRQPAVRVADVELEPIQPGAWAAWAKAWNDEQQVATTASAPATTSLVAAAAH